MEISGMRLDNDTGFALAAVCVVLIRALTGCAVGPDYTPPEMATPEHWAGQGLLTDARPADQAQTVRWWKAFGDPTLDALVERAVAGNPDMQGAKARIRGARAARLGAASGLWPSVESKSGYSHNRSVAAAGPGGTVSAERNLFQTGLDALWELDLFGGVRRSVEAADAELQARIEDLRDVLVTLAAEVALTYIDLRGTQEQLLIARRTLEAQRHTAQLVRSRFGAGLAGALDVARADALVATTASQIPALETTVRQTIYAISVLLGAEPARTLEELSEPCSIPPAPPHLPVVLPSELLARRPDIRRAQEAVRSATARIGVATADLFPRFNLIGSAGFQGTKLNDWLKWSNRVWSVGPTIDWQIFTAGKVRSNIEVQKAARDEALSTYTKTVLAAFQEVENALVAYAGERDRYKALEESVASNRKALDLARRLYTEGMTDFLDVLEAERSLYASEDALAQSRRTLSRQVVALYKALGGGWEEDSGAGGGHSGNM
jgi:multidrug efflux system outer membrane protein